MATMIKAEHLTFCYPDEPADHPPVLDDVNLEIEAGSFVAILGHNGSGKSTLAKHMNALLTPTAGKLWVEGLDTADPENLLAVRGKVGMVFQNPDNQIVANVVRGRCSLRPGKSGGSPAEIRQRVDDALRTWWGCMSLREHSPPSPLRRSEAAGGHRRHHCHACHGALCWMRPPPCWTPVGRREAAGHHPDFESKNTASP